MLSGESYLVLTQVGAGRKPSLDFYKLPAHKPTGFLGAINLNNKISDSPYFQIEAGEMLLHVDGDENIFYMTNKELMLE